MSPAPYRFAVGDLAVTVFDDGGFLLPVSFFQSIPPALANLIGDEVRLGANFWLVEDAERRILIDTGAGGVLKGIQPDTGAAADALTDLRPSDVVLTHMHADHIGVLADPDAFPGAQLHLSRAEWTYWTDPGLVEASPPEMQAMTMMIQEIANGIAERVTLHDGAAEIAPGVRLQPAPGHTPGHSAVRLESGGEALMIIADAAISENLQCAHPDVAYALEVDIAAAAATRRALFADCAAEGVRIAASHFAYPGVGAIATEGDGFRFDPL